MVKRSLKHGVVAGIGKGQGFTTDFGATAREAPSAMPCLEDDAQLLAARCIEARYLPENSDPGDEEKPFWLVCYKNEFTNNSAQAAVITARHWLIRPHKSPEQITNGFGLGSDPGEFLLPPHSTRRYISGVPLPTSKGGEMTGHYSIRWLDGKVETTPVNFFELPPASDKGVKYKNNNQRAELRASPKDKKELNHVIKEYVENCREIGFATLDANDLPVCYRWAFMRLCLSQRRDGKPLFNEKKCGTLETIDIAAALFGLVALNKTIYYNELPYTDIRVVGHDFDNISVKLFYQKDEGCLKENLKKYLQSENVPPALWRAAAAEFEKVLRKLRAPKDRPLWDERHKYPELAKLSAPEFLKHVWVDQIGPDGSIESQTVTAFDPPLMNQVSIYISMRKSRGRDLGRAAGLTVITHKVGRPKKPELG